MHHGYLTSGDAKESATACSSVSLVLVFKPSLSKMNLLSAVSMEPPQRSSLDLVRYAKKGHYAKLVEVLDRGDNVNSVDSKKRSALFCAAFNGHKKCLKELLRRGANPNQ